ncbi:MAG TPA: hypothetical protein PKE47_10280, partial [Verrucomicrobiota bacterium]|nr:hypothetical protein [Verrucomicrobiota bacterium]
ICGSAEQPPKCRGLGSHREQAPARAGPRASGRPPALGRMPRNIRRDAARIVRGFDRSDTGMPSYEGVLADAQIEALVLYLKTVE